MNTTTPPAQHPLLHFIAIKNGNQFHYHEKTELDARSKASIELGICSDFFPADTITPKEILLTKAMHELNCIEQLCCEEATVLTVATIFQHSQRALNALHDLKNQVGAK